MRLRHATVAVAVLTVLGVAGCGDDPADPPPAAPAPSVSAGPSAGGAPSDPGASADPGTPPTEGTSSAKPPKKGTGAGQGPIGKPTTTP